ncbi:hypothetical protein FDUTEX481_03648 [Tolypothrix sp. PCC 7601]|nr:hypothetical protein FDUTEX481_03648 [Tolypothrix sp. PCC 7601]
MWVKFSGLCRNNSLIFFFEKFRIILFLELPKVTGGKWVH